MREMKNIKIVLYLLITLALTLGWLCEDWTPPPVWDDPDPTCGVGSGNYILWIDQDPADTFHCNTDARIFVRATPKIDNRYAGFHRAYLELSNSDTTFVSNWVNMTNSFNAQEFEIGGAIPAGTYNAKLWMINYQPYSTCNGWIYTHEEVDLFQVTVTACNPPSKKMTIENEWQYSDTIALETYDVLQFQDTVALRFAFHAVDTRDSIIAGDFVPMQFVHLVEPYTEFNQFIADNKGDSDRMYLCGVKEFVDAGNNPIVERAGFTHVTSDLGVVQPPSFNTGSVVAVKSILVRSNEYAQNPDLLGVNFKQMLEEVVIHELGHQRAVLGHDGHSSMFCVMHIDVIMPYGSSDYNLYSNPHFCENHMNLLKAVQW